MKQTNLQFLKDRQKTRFYFSSALDRLILTVYKTGHLNKEKTIIWPMIAEYFTAD